MAPILTEAERNCVDVVRSILSVAFLFDARDIMIRMLFHWIYFALRDPARGAIRRIVLAGLMVGGAVWSHACMSGEGNIYGPYFVIGYNYTDRHIADFVVDNFAAGPSEAHRQGGGGGIACCLGISKHAKTLHINVEFELTEEQDAKNLPADTFETDIPVPPLPDKHDGFVEFHFLPHQQIDAAWVSSPTMPHIPGALKRSGCIDVVHPHHFSM